MKKALLYGLSLAMLLSLAACHKPQADQQEPAPNQAATSEPVQDPAATPEPPEQNQVTPEQLSDTIPAAPDEVEDTELPEEEEQVQLFNDCNEVVYATGTVNIRISWSADSEKLGSLAVGDSVTRTGTSIAGTEAEGWSRVTLSSGTTAYISNSYLSTTKPVVQQQSTQGTTQDKPSGQTQQQQPTQQQQQTPPQQTSSDTDMSMSEIEQIMKEQFLKDREALKAEGWNGREGDGLTDEDIRGIGAILNGG